MVRQTGCHQGVSCEPDRSYAFPNQTLLERRDAEDAVVAVVRGPHPVGVEAEEVVQEGETGCCTLADMRGTILTWSEIMQVVRGEEVIDRACNSE